MLNSKEKRNFTMKCLPKKYSQKKFIPFYFKRKVRQPHQTQFGVYLKK